MSNQKEIRAAFWAAHPLLHVRAQAFRLMTAPQNRHCANTRAAFVDFVDALHREGRISDALAGRVTL
jgi:hypothetical protein